MDKPDKRIARRRRGGQPVNLNEPKHGRYTAEAKAQQRYVQALLREARATIKLVTDPDQSEEA